MSSKVGIVMLQPCFITGMLNKYCVLQPFSTCQNRIVCQIENVLLPKKNIFRSISRKVYYFPIFISNKIHLIPLPFIEHMSIFVAM